MRRLECIDKTMSDTKELQKLKENGKNGDDIFIKDQLVFMSQLKIRSKILKVLRENFDCKEILVIKEKSNENED